MLSMKTEMKAALTFLGEDLAGFALFLFLFLFVCWLVLEFLDFYNKYYFHNQKEINVI